MTQKTIVFYVLPNGENPVQDKLNALRRMYDFLERHGKGETIEGGE